MVLDSVSAREESEDVDVELLLGAETYVDGMGDPGEDGGEPTGPDVVMGTLGE
jgi:hypothetical protein